MSYLPTILVTGAGGFLGGWVVECLHLSEFAHVRAGVHRWSSAVRIARFPVELVECNVLEPDILRLALRDVDMVVHCALSADLRAVVEGTRNVLAAARARGLRRFVHISSVAVYGDLTGTVAELSDLQPDSDYGRAKAEAERFCQEFQNGGLPLVVLRPSNIYGPYGETWTVSYAMRLQSGRWGTFGAQGEGTCNLVHARDVVEAIRLALTLPQAVGEVFNINGSETLTWNQYFELFAEVLGLPELKQKDPKGAKGRALATQPVRILGKYMLKHHRDELVWLCNRSPRFKGLLKGIEEQLRSTANLVDMEAYQRKVAYPIEKARQLLSYSPQVSVHDGLVECCEWLRHQGLSLSQ